MIVSRFCLSGPQNATFSFLVTDAPSYRNIYISIYILALILSPVVRPFLIIIGVIK